MAVDPDLLPVGPSGRRFLAFAPLVRALGLAGDARKLVLGTVGLATLFVGWRLITSLFGIDLRQVSDFDPGATVRLFALRPDQRWADAAWLMTEPPRVVIGPFVALFTKGVGLQTWLCAVAMGLWALVVWGIVGGAIARIAGVQLTVGGGVGVGTAVRFALKRMLSLVGAPLTPFLAVALLAAGSATFGLIYRIPGGVGATIAGVLGFIPLLLGLLMALILVGLALGWPLMHATVAIEGEDVADALSRSYSYVNQRTIRYLAHLTVAWLLGALGLVVTLLFARVVLSLADWGMALGMPPAPVMVPVAELTHDFWAGVVGWLAHAYIYSYFWSATAVIYLILREDVDGTDPHDIFLPEQAADAFADVAITADLGPTEPAAMPEVAQPGA